MHESQDRLRECMWIALLDDESVNTVSNHFGKPTDATGDNWAACCQPFEGDIPQGLDEPLFVANRRHNHDVRRGEIGRHVVARHCSDERHVLCEAEAAGTKL